VPNRRALLTGLASSAAVSAIAGEARGQDGGSLRPRDVVAVLGTGHFGGTIGPRLTRAGHTIVYGSRAPRSAEVRQLVNRSGPRASAVSLEDAVSRAGIVVFAVPWKPIKAILAGLGSLSGKVVIDPMIADPKMSDGYLFPGDSSKSAAEQLQSWIPTAQVISAFSTIWYKDLANPGRASGPISIPLAGNDKLSRDRAAGLISDIGLHPVDLGTLVAARYIETLLWMEVMYIARHQKKRMFELYMRPVPT
jgi:8-hydroxy-5-deazaflavin:NADPH oxidoreductase